MNGFNNRFKRLEVEMYKNKKKMRQSLKNKKMNKILMINISNLFKFSRYQILMHLFKNFQKNTFLEIIILIMNKN